MRPDAHAAMRNTLAFGPGHCPRDLFDGAVAGIVRGLKVHANQIAHARHVALEETYPRLRERMGAEAFHVLAEVHLASGRVFGKSLDALGTGLERLLDSPALRDLARVELAWLQAYHARDAEALMMADIVGLTPEALLDVAVARHPAARVVAIEDPGTVPWDETAIGEGGFMIVTRPGAKVLLRRIDDVLAWNFTRTPARTEEYLLAGVEPAALFGLVEAGALILQGS